VPSAASAVISNMPRRSYHIATKTLKAAEFITKARQIHGRRYDYSGLVYVNQSTRVRVICRTHGPFLSFPHNHLRGHGCAACARQMQAHTRMQRAGDEFIARAKKKHGNRYDYSKTAYKGAGRPVAIFCKIHKRFFQIIANNHLQGRGCQKCGRKNQLAAALKKRLTASRTFISRATKVHGSKYDYSRVRYKDSKTPVRIVCPSASHGEFRQAPHNHLLGKGCPSCGSMALAIRTLQKRKEIFLRHAQKVHGTKYDYSQVVFKNTNHKVTVICPIHGEFMVRPTHHTATPYSGCPICIESLGEKAIRRVLKRWRVAFESEKRFSDCRDKRPLAFDFWLPSLNVLIEYDGKQHFDGDHYLSTLSDFASSQHRDRIKTAYARKKKIRLIRVKYSVRDVEAYLVRKLGLK
jgi:hypothetical protein